MNIHRQILIYHIFTIKIKYPWKKSYYIEINYLPTFSHKAGCLLLNITDIRGLNRLFLNHMANPKKPVFAGRARELG
jgi:hypothetical protein